MWHASVSLLDLEKGKTLEITKLSAVNKAILIATAKSMLTGVGQIPSEVAQGTLAIHYRRCLTEAEIADLPQSWCAIPAVDGAGLDVVLEQDT